MLGFEDLKISILERKVADIEKRIEEIESFVKILKQQGEVKSDYECDPGFMIPSDREGVKRNDD